METFQSLIKEKFEAHILSIEKAIQIVCVENGKLKNEISKNQSCIEDFNKNIVRANALVQDNAKLKGELKELIEKIKLEEVKPVKDAYCNVLECRLDQIFQKEDEIRNNLSTFLLHREDDSSQDSPVPVSETADVISDAETESNSDMEILMPDNIVEEATSPNIQTVAEADLVQDRRKEENNIDVNTNIITKEEPQDDNENEVHIVEPDNYTIIKKENQEFDATVENNSTKPTERIQKCKPKKRKRKFENIIKIDEYESRSTKILKKVGQKLLDPEPDTNNINEKQEHASIEELLQEDCDEKISPRKKSPKIVHKITKKGKKTNKTKKKVANYNRFKCNCKGCETPPCGICANCKDKPVNGGRNKLRQRCQKRICLLKQGKTESIQKNKKPRHKSSNSSTSGVTVIQCPIPGCLSTFTQRQNMKIHISGTHLKQILQQKFEATHIDLKIMPGSNPCPFSGCDFVGQDLARFFYHYGFVHKVLKNIENDNIKHISHLLEA